MKKFNKLSLLWLLVLVLPVYLFATRFKVSEVNNKNFLSGYDYSLDKKVNTSLFYQNIGSVKYAADPQVITVGNKYYMYATNANKNYDCSYLQCFSSTNLTDWKNEGICFQPSRDNWCIDGLWAPEVIEKDGMFYLYFSGFKIFPENNGASPLTFRGHQISVATSSSPTGPFIEVKNELDPLEAKFATSYAAIDASPFIDDNGEAYLLITKDQEYVNEEDIHSSILIGKLKDNMVELEGVEEGDVFNDEAFVKLIEPSMDFENINKSTHSWNEAPFMVKRDGKYYLFYSANYYEDREYCVCVCEATSPFDSESFMNSKKVLLSALDSWDYVSGTGHCSIFKSVDGKEDFMAYHVHENPTLGGSERMIYFDRVTFNSLGVHVNGPSISPQPLPSGSSEYFNIGFDSTIYVNDNKVIRLNDNYINTDPFDISKEENTYSKEVHIKIKFNELKKVRAISLYDSSNYSYSLNNIDKITINDKIVVNIPMKESYISGYKIPSSSFIYEFDEIETDEINIYLSSENIIYLNELMILGK